MLRKPSRSRQTHRPRSLRAPRRLRSQNPQRRRAGKSRFHGDAIDAIVDIVAIAAVAHPRPRRKSYCLLPFKRGRRHGRLRPRTFSRPALPPPTSAAASLSPTPPTSKRNVAPISITPLFEPSTPTFKPAARHAHVQHIGYAHLEHAIQRTLPAHVLRLSIGETYSPHRRHGHYHHPQETALDDLNPQTHSAHVAEQALACKAPGHQTHPHPDEKGRPGTPPHHPLRTRKSRVNSTVYLRRDRHLDIASVRNSGVTLARAFTHRHHTLRRNPLHKNRQPGRHHGRYPNQRRPRIQTARAAASKTQHPRQNKSIQTALSTGLCQRNQTH